MYHNQSVIFNFNVLGVTSPQIESPAQDQTYDSDEILTIALSYDDSVKNIPIDNADVQWKVGLGGTYSSTNVTYVSGDYQIGLWLSHSEFDGYGPFTIYTMLNKTNYRPINILTCVSNVFESTYIDQRFL